MNDKPPCRWLAFRLRTLFVIVFVVCATLAWYRLPYGSRFELVQKGQTRLTVLAIMGAPEYCDGWQLDYSDSHAEYSVYFCGQFDVATYNRRVVSKFRVPFD